MISIHEEFFTKERANAFRLKMLRDFPQATFGTVLTVAARRGQFWECSGRRFA